MERILDDYQPVEQAGFRKNFSCMDNIQAATQLIERSREYHLLLLVFVDYKKAFDSVETNAGLNALAHAGVPSVFIRLLEQCFSNTSTIILLFDRKLRIPIERRVRQRDKISPKLFTAALQYVEFGIRLGRQKIQYRREENLQPPLRRRYRIDSEQHGRDGNDGQRT
ncbi:hypothetical protein Y032_0489g2366 [Ancylostoma ceylanicum]|nr:hypothetical protein Y032_0489g2366 [Ancylostoma ceylanicum]